MAIHVIYIRSHDYNKVKQDGGVMKTVYLSNSDCTCASVNHTVTF